MTTYTITFNEQSKVGKAFKSMTETFFKDSDDILIVKKSLKKETDIYNPKFVNMIKKAEKRANFTTINPKDLWGSLGLK